MIAKGIQDTHTHTHRWGFRRSSRLDPDEIQRQESPPEELVIRIWPLHQAEILNRKILRQGDEPWQGKSFLRQIKEYSKWEITKWKKCFRTQFARLNMSYRNITLWHICTEWTLVRKTILSSDVWIQALWMKVIECVAGRKVWSFIVTHFLCVLWGM